MTGPKQVDREAMSKLVAQEMIHLVGPSVTAKEFRSACNRVVYVLHREGLL